MKPSQSRAEARSFYRRKGTTWLLNKRARLAVRLLGLEDVCSERGYPALPRKTVEMLGQMVSPPRKVRVEANDG